MSSLVKWFGPTNALVMAPNSPKLSLTDRIKQTVVYVGQQSYLATQIVPRGAFGSGMYSGFVCNSCTLDTSRGDVGTLTIEWEAGGSAATQPLPVGSFSLKPQEIYPKLERAECFQWPIQIDPMTVNICHCANEMGLNNGGSVMGGTTLLTQKIVAGGPDGTNYYNATTAAEQLLLAQKLLAKWAAGEETFYLVAWRYTYETFSYTAPTVSKGGVPGTPGGPLAAYLPPNVSWLRLADDCDPAGVAGSMYKLTTTWLGGPIWGGIGYWDTDIYT